MSYPKLFTPSSLSLTQISVLGKAFSSLARPLFLFLVRRTGGDTELAREIVQETYVAAEKSLATFQKKSTLFTWVCKIALHKLADYYRRKVNRSSMVFVPLAGHLDQLVDPQITPLERLSLEELVESVKKCLNLLPNRYKQLLQLRYYENLSYQEISLRVGLSERSVEGLLYRAKKDFKKLYLLSSPPIT